MNPEESRTEFSQMLAEKMKERGLNLKRLSEISGIAMGHLEHLARGDFEELPPAPYVHGYLTRLAPLLDFEAEHWWNRLKLSGIKTSGAEDKLPHNRFAKKSVKKYFWIPIVLILLVIYLGSQIGKILGKPIITIYEPSENITKTETSRFTVSGKLANGNEVKINGDTVFVAGDGAFQKEITLSPGPNTINVSAKKFLGSEVSTVRQIFYEPKQEAATGTRP